MNRKKWIFVLVPVMGLFVMISAIALAGPRANMPTRFDAFGVVSNANPEIGTITVTVNRASKGLQNKFGENVTFHTWNVSRVGNCSMSTNAMSGCWKQLSENAGMKGREAERGEWRAQLGQIKNGDWVYISGSFDKRSGRFKADEILKQAH